MNSESKSRVVHENLDTAFVNLWALLRNLSQRGFIGRVRVELKDYTADVFMTGSNTPLVHEIDRAAGTDTPDEAVAVPGSAALKTETDGADPVSERDTGDSGLLYAPDAPTETDKVTVPS